MTRLTVIPAIDLINGQCVRLSQGDYAQKTVYADDPLALAQHFEALGAKQLHLVDLDGAKAKKVVNLKVLESIKKHTHLKVDFGGGIQSDEDMRQVMGAGADMVTCGSIAVKNRDLFEQWLERYGPEAMILAADSRNGQIAIHGWQDASLINTVQFIRDFHRIGVLYVLCTDIARDGMLTGPATDFYRQIVETLPTLRLIASGGISQASDFNLVEEAGCWGVVTGKAIYENKISDQELADWFVK